MCAVNPNNGKSYAWAMGTGATWSGGEFSCQQIGANTHLATINDAAEDAWISGFVAGAFNAQVWIGANDMATEGTFQWVNGEPFSFTNWRNGQPNDPGGDQDCVVYETDMNAWSDISCSFALTFVCEVN